MRRKVPPGYIIKGYDPLHTFDSECIADDLISYMTAHRIFSDMFAGCYHCRKKRANRWRVEKNIVALQ